MAFKLVVFVAALACANAGLIGAPVAAPVAYSPASAVSSSYIHQAQPAAVVAHAAPVAYAAHAAPVAYAAHAAPVAYAAHAAPVAYAAHAAPVAVHAPAIGASQQSVVRSLGGNQAVSHYSKAVDSAFSSVRKFDTRITNDAISVAAAPVAYAAPVAHAAYAAPVAHAAYAAPVAHAAYAAPVAHAAYAAPVAHAAYAHAAPVIAKTAAVAYSPAAVVSHASFTGLGTSYAW